MPMSPAVAAVLCGLLGLIVWQVIAARRLARRKAELDQARQQLLLYRAMGHRGREGPDARRGQEQIELSLTIYRGVLEEYNRCLKKPGSRFSAWLLGCRPVDEGVDS